MGAMILRPVAIGYLQLTAFSLCGLVFFIFLIQAFARRLPESGATRDRRSQVGIAVQGIGMSLAGFGVVRPSLAALGASSLAATTVVLILMGGAIGLFAASSRELGRNWSLVARTRTDHELVRTGPYAKVRHPIYLGMLLFLLAMAVALGHWLQLLAALPLFFIGTAMRTHAEDDLLEQSFGESFRNYRRSTPALLPRIF